MTAAISSASAAPATGVSNAGKIAALQKQVTALQKQLKDVQASAATSAADPKAAAAAKAQTTLITAQIQSVEQQISALSQQSAQAKAVDRPSAARTGATPRADPDDAEKARRRLQGETMGTAVDTWA